MILKSSLCGKNSSHRYIAGEHYTSETLCLFSQNRIVTGRQLWTAGNDVLANLRKAVSLVQKLKGIVVITANSSDRVIGYASGKNEETFFKYILNGMYQMEEAAKKRKGGIVGKLCFCIHY